MDNSSLISALIAVQPIDQTAADWIEDKLHLIASSQSSKDFYIAFSSVYRYVPKQPVVLEAGLEQQIKKVYPPFKASSWSADQLCRIAFVLALKPENNRVYLENLFTTADVNELVALYKSLYFLNNAEDFTTRAAEGVRTNMTSVFDAIALENPFPARFLDEEAWNQMVLKAIFMQRPVYKIYEVDSRKNPKLAKILADYAHERWAAGRMVSPELWRMVGGFVDQTIFNDLTSVVEKGSPTEQKAAAKALEESNFAPAIGWLQERNIKTDEISWDDIGRAAQETDPHH